MATQERFDVPWLDPGYHASAMSDSSALRARLIEEGLDPGAWSNGPGDRYASHDHAYDKVIVVAAGSIRFGLTGGGLELAEGDRLELLAGTAHDALVGPDGVDETYGSARWLTIYDGSGVADPAFLGPTYAHSPALLGADNREVPGTYHNDLRIDAAIVAEYRAFLEEADAQTAADASPSNGGAVTPLALLVLAAGAARRRTDRRTIKPGTGDSA